MSRAARPSTFSSPERRDILSSEAPQQSLVETKLIASDGLEGDQFGLPLAIGGNILVIGAPNTTIDGRRGAGAVYIFLRDSPLDPWIEHKRLLPNEGDFQSSEMCIAIDCETLVVGAPYATLDNFQEGAVYIFERNAGGGDNWAQVAKLTNPSVGFGGHFGSSIAIQGGLLAVGASASNQHHGQVQIFERDRGGPANWGLVTTLSYGAAQDAAWVRAFGSSVALDGDQLLIGAEDTDVSYFYMADGAAYLFQRDAVNPDNWSYVTRFISPGADQCVGGRKLSDFWISSSAEESSEAKRCAQQDVRTSNDDFGCAVLLQCDLAVIGASFAEGDDGGYGAGAAHVFRRDGSGTDQWVHVATLAPRESAQGAYFGTALALASDTLIVGAPGTNVGTSVARGKAYVFERNAGGSDQWGETMQLAPSDGFSNADFGKAIALDSESRIVGAMGDSNWRGAVYVFAPSTSPDQPPPAFPPTGELVNGGIVEAPNGVLIGALEAALSQPLPVWIQKSRLRRKPRGRRPCLSGVSTR
jgi:FG-GAP repeat